MAKSNKYFQSTQMMFLAMAAVFAVVAVLVLTKRVEEPRSQVQGAQDVSAQEMLNQLNQTVDDAGQSEVRVIKGQVTK